MSLRPACKCGKEYTDIRTFRWGRRLLCNYTEFSIHVCDKCRCYWYDDSLPLEAKQYAFDTFDWFPEGHRLPSPDTIRQHRETYPESYPELDLGKYERGEISDRHPDFYEFYAEHLQEEISRRNTAMEELSRQIRELGAEMARAQETIVALSMKRLECANTLARLAKTFVKEKST